MSYKINKKDIIREQTHVYDLYKIGFKLYLTKDNPKFAGCIVNDGATGVIIVYISKGMNYLGILAHEIYHAISAFHNHIYPDKELDTTNDEIYAYMYEDLFMSAFEFYKPQIDYKWVFTGK